MQRKVIEGEQCQSLQILRSIGLHVLRWPRSWRYSVIRSAGSSLRSTRCTVGVGAKLFNLYCENIF